MSDITNKCLTDCNKTFPELFHQALADICFLGSVSGGDIEFVDRRVSVTASDTSSSELADKLQGVSGIDFTVTEGVSGQIYVASLDLDFLDDRYSNQTQNILSFDIKGGLSNGLVRFCELNNSPSLRFINEGNPSTSWSVKIPKDFFPGQSQIKIGWTASHSVSGSVVFDVEYNSIKEGEIVTLPFVDTSVSVHDGTPNKLSEVCVDIGGGVIEDGDLFLLKLTRKSADLEDTLDSSINIINVSLNYNES